jgi:RNA polymerase sigma factor (sigma-70 family)
VEHLRKTVLRREEDTLSDGQLLDRFLEKRDEVAFAALVRRHGPMVWGVCRRIVGHAHDAEDAFQAAFLILVRKAAAVKWRAAVGNWLYGVACHAALKARTASARVRAKEKQVTSMPEPAMEPRKDREELQMLLDQELTALPDKYRLPVVLCDLEGRTRKAVAAQLKIPEGTLSSRLATAHQMLAKRLARHGLAVSGGSLAALFAQNAASASVPAAVVSSTIKTATLVAARQGAVAGVVSTKVAALTEGVMKAMLLTKLKIATAVLLVVGSFGSAAGLLSYQALGGQHLEVEQTEQPKPPAKSVKNADVAQSEERLKGKTREELMRERETLRQRLDEIEKRLAELDIAGPIFVMMSEPYEVVQGEPGGRNIGIGHKGTMRRDKFAYFVASLKKLGDKKKTVPVFKARQFFRTQPFRFEVEFPHEDDKQSPVRVQGLAKPEDCEGNEMYGFVRVPKEARLGDVDVKVFWPAFQGIEQGSTTMNVFIVPVK